MNASSNPLEPESNFSSLSWSVYHKCKRAHKRQAQPNHLDILNCHVMQQGLEFCSSQETVVTNIAFLLNLVQKAVCPLIFKRHKLRVLL